MALWTNVDENAGKPKFLSTADKAKTFGISSREASANGLIPGWNLKTVGTGGRAGRVTYEPLVAMGSITGDNDNIGPEISMVLTNGSGTVVIPGTHTFTLTVVPPVGVQPEQIQYLWQESADDGNTWNSLPNSNTANYTTEASDIGMNGAIYKYRCLVTTPVTDTEISPIGILVFGAP